ncbi:hypothetical protein PITCH_A1910065 [uncultured Desulfobacterium sp.]|uniref:Uncharacterized protein n=1 Tax=uncultured Desulfobacterium sp. TaxID=201089 RepID=A0A445MW74_9BACT|nr:hypothetical protein PITCH_A1910065 [uncultured Desulfobacterium sp.]
MVAEKYFRGKREYAALLLKKQGNWSLRLLLITAKKGNFEKLPKNGFKHSKKIKETYDRRFCAD